MIDLYKGDCLKIMENFEDKSIDMILCDLPYGTTNCKWDTVIDLSLLWQQYNRLIKDSGAIALFGNNPFSSVLINSAIKIYRYDWIIEKSHVTGHLNAKKMPMKAHEYVHIFYKRLPVYNPQKTLGHKRKISMAKHKRSCIKSEIYNSHNLTDYDSTERYPRSVLKFKWDKQTRGTIHPTQKPVSLTDYFVKTYTNEGDIVLDNCMGVGGCGVSCKKLNRHFKGIEIVGKYFNIAKERIGNS